MDNITHSLAGLLLAGTAIAWRARQRRDADRDRSFVTVAAVTGVVGANLPDSDVLWGAAMQAAGVYDNLLSLLHHRGYTHTVLAAVLFIPMLWAAAIWWLRRRQHDVILTARERSIDRRALLGLAVLSVCSHVTLDYTNDYGVHPLSPFMNAWSYGDSVFIIEPWLWVVAVPMVLRGTRRRAARVALWMVLLLGLALCWVVPQVSLMAAAVVTAGGVAVMLLSRLVPSQRAPMVGVGAWLLVTLLSVAGTYTIRQSVRAQLTMERQAMVQGGGDAVQTARLVDVMMSPSPANPLCARVIAVETTPTDYRLTTAWGSALPALVSAAQCATAVQTDTTPGAQTLPMVRATRVDSPAIDWQWTWHAPRAELATLARENCRVAAWLRFVRAPFWVRGAGDSLRVGDLRYDRERVSVAAFTFAPTTESCPHRVPPWMPPRVGVLQEGAAD